MRLSRIAAVMPVMTIALGLATASAHADAITQTNVTRLPISFVAGNIACTEFIQFEGTVVLVDHFTESWIVMAMQAKSSSRPRPSKVG